MRRWIVYAGVSAAMVLLLAASCSLGRVQTRNYYILSYTVSPNPPSFSQRPYPYSLQVERFGVQRIYTTQNILYRFSPHQIQYYAYQQWAARPEDMFTDLVLNHLRESGLVNRVGTDFFESRPDYRLDGVVDAIERFDADDLFYAHLAMSFRLTNGETDVQEWEYSFDQRRRVFQPEMVHTVEALSGILQQEMRIVIAQLDSLFYTRQTGTPAPPVTATLMPQAEPGMETVPSGTLTDEGLDESTFEIIRDSGRPQEAP